MTEIVLGCLAAVNLTTFAVYGIDKYKSMHGKWRIPERTLLLLAATGGSIGALAGMEMFRHKTKHLKFKYGVPVILLIQIAMVAWLTVQEPGAHQAFTREAWRETEHTERIQMVPDLQQKYELKGMTKDEVIDLLGESDYYQPDAKVGADSALAYIVDEHWLDGCRALVLDFKHGKVIGVSVVNADTL